MKNIQFMRTSRYLIKIISNGMRIAYCPDAAVIHSHNFTYYDILRRYFDAGSVWKRIGIFRQNDHLYKLG